MTTADTLICSLEIGAEALLGQAQQFEAAVACPAHRSEAASLLRGLAAHLSKTSARLDLPPYAAEALRRIQEQQPAQLN